MGGGGLKFLFLNAVKIFRGRAHLGAEHLHPEDVKFLSLAVHGPHVDDTFHAQERADGGRGDPVLSSARLGDNAVFADALGQERLSHGVVDLVRAGVR